MIGFQSFMALLHKADFIYERHNSKASTNQIILKRGKKKLFFLEITFSTTTTIITCTCSSKAPPRITLEEVNLAFVSGTSSTQVLIIPFKLFYDHRPFPSRP